MIRVGVLRGGTGKKYDDSLKTGAYVLRNLPREHFEPIDIFIDKSGVWHLGGAPVSYDKLRARVDVIWNTLHGFYGEDGKVQQLLESLGLPYMGSGPLASAITMNKRLLKERLAALGVKTPRGIYIDHWGTDDRDAAVSSVVQTVSQKLSPPWIVEPVSRGQANGEIRSTTRDELAAVLYQMFDANLPVLVEEAVLGRQASVVALDKFRGQDVYTFPATYADDSRRRMSPTGSMELQALAQSVHKGLDMRHYSRIEAIVTPKGDLYVTNVETMPILHDEAGIHESLASTGSSFKEVSKHLIDLALGHSR